MTQVLGDDRQMTIQYLAIGSSSYCGEPVRIGHSIRRSLKTTQIASLAGILPAFLKCLFFSVRQKVRQFAVDTELLVTCKSTC